MSTIRNHYDPPPPAVTYLTRSCDIASQHTGAARKTLPVRDSTDASVIAPVDVAYDSVSTKADKLRLAIRYLDNSRRIIPVSMMVRDTLDEIGADYDAVERKLRAQLAALDALMDEMEAV